MSCSTGLNNKQAKQSFGEDTILADTYARFLQRHEGVLRDEVTMLGYKAAMEANGELFRGATVLEVGCGSALLSMWAARQGAARVIAVESSAVCQVARMLVQQNKLQHVIEVLQGNVEELELPLVDIIISKWMGACLMYSSVLEAVIFARDKFLKPGGSIFPHIANLYIAAAEQPRNPQHMFSSRLQYWTQYSGLNLSHACRIVKQTPLVRCLDATQVITQRQVLQRFDMRTLCCNDLSFTVPFKLRCLRQSIAKWFLLYFDFRFPGDLKPISTSPSCPATQWKQTLFHIDAHVPLCVNDLLCGQFQVKRSVRHLDFDIDWSFHSDLEHVQLHKQIYRMQGKKVKLSVSTNFEWNTISEQSCSISRKDEEMLNYIHEMKEKIDNNDILTMKKNNQINELQQKVTQLQENVSENVYKDQLIDLYKNKDDSNSVHIKDLKSELSDLQETINFFKKIIAELPNKCSLSIKTELNELCTIKSEPLQKQIAAYSKSINEKNDQIKQLNKQINDDAMKYEKKENQFRKQFDSSTNAIQEKETIIQNLNIQAKNNTNNLTETQGKLTLCETKLNNFEPEASSCVSFKTYSGIHQIEVPGIDKFDVLCDSKTAGPGWIVIQQRINGKEDFYRNFTTYQNGFGSFDGDFFLGLEKIHRLTKHKQHQLFIHMERFNGESNNVSYDHFAISGESDQYRLINVDGYSGTAYRDYLKYQKYMEFYTFDRDNEHICARKSHSGWWHDNCALGNLNGKYFGYAKNDDTSIFWDGYESLKTVQMLIRPKVN